MQYSTAQRNAKKCSAVQYLHGVAEGEPLEELSLGVGQRGVKLDVAVHYGGRPGDDGMPGLPGAGCERER